MIDELSFLHMVRQYLFEKSKNRKNREEYRKVINIIFRDAFGFPKEVNYLMNEVKQ